MPGVPHILDLVGFNPGGLGGQVGCGRLSIDIPPFNVLTAGSGANVQVGQLILLNFPPGIVPPNYVLESIEFNVISAVGTLVAATFDLKTNAVSLLTAPIAIAGLTAANKRLLTAGPATANVQIPATVPAALTLTLSQTVDSANAGVLAGRIHLMLLPSA